MDSLWPSSGKTLPLQPPPGATAARTRASPPSSHRRAATTLSLALFLPSSPPPPPPTLVDGRPSSTLRPAVRGRRQAPSFAPDLSRRRPPRRRHPRSPHAAANRGALRRRHPRCPATNAANSPPPPWITYEIPGGTAPHIKAVDRLGTNQIRNQHKHKHPSSSVITDAASSKPDGGSNEPNVSSLILKVTMLPSWQRKCRYPFKDTAGLFSSTQHKGGCLPAGLQYAGLSRTNTSQLADFTVPVSLSG
ncbi:hypothetical protein U9M48_009518 [Paspalum notatum var. saurae]|uniref:Uncharacterized protein n=1 Tax=Paspalum notatum var. saurae TaxID=547442 RepID=A0AAQ3WF56_PASNO